MCEYFFLIYLGKMKAVKSYWVIHNLIFKSSDSYDYYFYFFKICYIKVKKNINRQLHSHYFFSLY